MPWVNIAGTWVHVKMSKRRVSVCKCELGPGAGLCGALTVFLCDYPVGKGTCDAPLCYSHATEVGHDRHYCPAHVGKVPVQEELF